MSICRELALLSAVSLTLTGCLAAGKDSMEHEHLLCSEILVVIGNLPLPADAEPAASQPEHGCAFATHMIEPELFDFYTHRLQANGWRRQAPTEAMVGLPHQVWRRHGVELRIEIQGIDYRDRTLVWLHALESEIPQVTPAE